jgi:CTP:molybdopterin cytidylyltransferase MocA
MGHRPKCLLEWDGVSLLRRQCLALLDVGVQDLVVVAGHYAQRIQQSVQDLPLQWALNPRPDDGQVASLRCGLQALCADMDAVLVALSDQPFISPIELRDLMAAYGNRPLGTEVVQPHVGGLPGNPVMFSAGVRAQILAGPESMGCRQWQLLHPQKVYAWPTHNGHYRADVDSPSDLAEVVAQSGQALTWPPDLAT